MRKEVPQRGGKKTKPVSEMLRNDADMCEFPYHEFTKKTFTGRIGLIGPISRENFEGRFCIQCKASDTPLKSAELPCPSSLSNTIAERESTRFFKYSSKAFYAKVHKMMMKAAISEWIMYAGNFFSLGSNVCLQTLLDAEHSYNYDKVYYAIPKMEKKYI